MKKYDMTLGDCINIFYPVIIAILFLVIDNLIDLLIKYVDILMY